MVSIIISSYQQKYLEALKINLEQTIKSPYEVIAVENIGLMGICEAYNIGAAKAKYPYLCFAHEDILFKTDNWPQPLIDKFESDLDTGVIGVAGGKYKSLAPSIWLSGEKELDLIHIIQHSKSKKNECINYLEKDFEEVVCLDGVFLFTKKEIWIKNKFDEITFSKFHCYDIDFSFNIGQSKKVFVTNEVLLEHFSMGSYDKSWIDESIKFHSKWKFLLPKGVVNKNLEGKIEYHNTITFLLRMLSFDYPLPQLFSVGFGFGFKKFFTLTRALTIFKIITFGYTKKLLWLRK